MPGSVIVNQPTFFAKELATFVCRSSNISLGDGKSMLSLVNAAGSGVILKIREIYLKNVQETTISGVIVSFGLRRITGHSNGTNVDIRTYDTQDTINSNVTAKFGATVNGENSTSLHLWKLSSDDFIPGTLDLEGMQTSLQSHFPLWKQVSIHTKPIVIREDEGISLKCITNTTAGTFDVIYVFTQE